MADRPAPDTRPSADRLAAAWADARAAAVLAAVGSRGRPAMTDTRPTLPKLREALEQSLVEMDHNDRAQAYWATSNESSKRSFIAALFNHPAVAAAIEAEALPSVDALAAALRASGLIARLSDYAMRAHPDTMRDEDEATVARSWAAAVLAALGEARDHTKEED